MKTKGNFFTGAAYNFAALSIVISFAAGLTACGNHSGRSEQKKPANLELQQEKADAGLRNALVIESQLRSEQVYLGVSDYLRADAVSAMRTKLAHSSDAEILRWLEQIRIYKAQIVTAIRAVDIQLIYYTGPASALTDRRDTAHAFLIELKAAAAARRL